MKILTANTALGIADSDSLLGDVYSLIKFHGWKVIPFLLTGNRLSGVLGYTSKPKKNRLAYFKKHSSYEKTLSMLKEADADVVVLNEIIYQLFHDSLESTLRALGYTSIVWGFAAHHADATVATLVASKLPAAEAACPVPQAPQMGGGGGACALRLSELPVTIVGCHLANGIPPFIRTELEALTGFAKTEMHDGRSVMFAGDFNSSDAFIRKTKRFDTLGLASVQSVCPVCLPQLFQNECDHIYAPATWKMHGTKYFNFGSDHLAVLVDVEPF